MYLIGEKAEFDCVKSPDYIKELLFTDYATAQLERAIRVLKGNCQIVSREIGFVCIAAYILLEENEDRLFHKLKEPPIYPKNYISLSREECEQLLVMLSRVDLRKIRRKIEFDVPSLSIQKNKATFPDPATRELSCRAGISDSRQQPVLKDSASGHSPSVDSDFDSPPRASASATVPRLYDQSGRLNGPYADLLRGLGITSWLVEIAYEKPIEVLGQMPEEQFTEKLNDANASLAHRLLQFIRYKPSPGLKFSLDGFSSGNLFNLSEFVLSPSQNLNQFLGLPFGGTIGLFLKMAHPKLGKKVFMLTSAHVVFSGIKDSPQQDIERFNQLQYAHFDNGRQTDPNYTQPRLFPS